MAEVELQTSCCKEMKVVENHPEWWVISNELKEKSAFELRYER